MDKSSLGPPPLSFYIGKTPDSGVWLSFILFLFSVGFGLRVRGA